MNNNLVVRRIIMDGEIDFSCDAIIDLNNEFWNGFVNPYLNLADSQRFKNWRIKNNLETDPTEFHQDYLESLLKPSFNYFGNYYFYWGGGFVWNYATDKKTKSQEIKKLKYPNNSKLDYKNWVNSLPSPPFSNGYVEFEFPENIRSKKDFDKLIAELFLNGIENFHPEDDFTAYEKLDDEEGKQVNNLFHQAINFLGDSELYKTLTKMRDKYLDLKYVYKVEHIRGYDFNEDQSHKISFTSLHNIKDEEWNMSAYHGEEWEEQFRNLKIGEIIESLVICEWVRFTRIF